MSYINFIGDYKYFLNKYTYTATAAQDTFSGGDDAGDILSYTVNHIQVFLNGVLLADSDYTANNSSSVILAEAAGLDDVLTVLGFKTFDVADTYNQGYITTQLSNKLHTTNNLSDVDDLALARENLGVEIGQDVQAYDASILNGAAIAGFEATGNHTNYTDNLDSITSNSEYGIDSTTVTNEPSDFIGFGFLKTHAWSANECTQTLTALKTEQHAVWMRHRNTGTWGAWKKVAGIDAKAGDIASAAALPVTTEGNYYNVSGTAAITSINSVFIGYRVRLHFNAAATLTHHATNLVLPGGADITTADGDEAEFVEYATGDWRCVSYIYGNSAPVSLANDQIWTAPQRAESDLTDTDASYDIATDQDFYTAITGGVTISFTGMATGRRGMILFNNTNGSTVAKNSYVKCDGDFLTTLSDAGVYLVSYFTKDATNVYVSCSQALS